MKYLALDNVFKKIDDPNRDFVEEILEMDEIRKLKKFLQHEVDNAKPFKNIPGDTRKVLALRNTNILSECKNCPSYLNPDEFQNILDDIQNKCDEQIKSMCFTSFNYFANGLDKNHPINQIKFDKNLFK